MDWNDTDHIDPGGHWLGWRLRGRFLISPDGDRITPERLRGFLFTEHLRHKLRPRPQQRDVGRIDPQEHAAKVRKLRTPPADG